MWDYGEDNRGLLMAEVSIAMAAVSVFAVSLRSYTMGTILHRFVIEDYLAVFTCLLQCGFCAVVVIGVSYGLGAHVANVPEENRHKALIFKWAGQVAYIVVSTIVKFVVGIFLLRLCVNNTWQRITIIVLLCVVGLFNVFYVFLAIFQCQPIEFYWYRYTENPPVTGKCNGHMLATVPTYFAVLIGLVSDLILALLPATLIKGANLDKKTKISVCCVLALGSLASVATIARIPYAKQLLSNPDYTYNFTDLAMWSIAECGIGITASSLATLRPLFVQMKLLANTHFSTLYGHSRMGSSGLPIQSANSVTVITSRGRSMKSRRDTAMTGSTAVSGAMSLTGGLKSIDEGREGGIQVQKEFELSVMSKETSPDSIDRLEAEVNEVITPGSRRGKAGYERKYASRRSSYGSQPRPPRIQTEFRSPPTSAENTASSASSSSGPRSMAGPSWSNPSSPQTRLRPSGGPGHGDVNHADSRPRTSSATYQPPSFHLPTRLQHQRNSSNQSGLSRFDSRGTTYQGLSAPPRVLQPEYGGYSPSEVATVPLGSPLGSPFSITGRSRRSTAGSTSQPVESPSSASRYPFPIQEVPETKRRGKQRVSAFLANADELSASSVDAGREEDIQEEPDYPMWPSPEAYATPQRNSPRRAPEAPGNWV